MAMTPLRESSSHTNPIRRILVSRSSLLKPSPLERFVLTTSPSSSSTLAPAARSRRSIISEMVLFPAPDRPVNHSVKPLCISAREEFVQQYVYLPDRPAIGGEVDAA